NQHHLHGNHTQDSEVSEVSEESEESDEEEPLQDNRLSQREHVLAQQQTSDIEQNDGVLTPEPEDIDPVIRNQTPPKEATDITNDLAIMELKASCITAVQ
ncbi:hypothetical protein BGZ76_000574, partial [Entomortierella beljakovae]